MPRLLLGLLLSALVLTTGSALAATNAAVPSTVTPYNTVVGGVRTDNILVYSDDYQAHDYLLAALNAEGLAYTLFYGDPTGFRTAVQSGAYNAIFVSHENYFEVSYAWGDLINAYNAGAKLAVFTFDWDGSHDYSGRVRDLLALGEHTQSRDIATQGSVYVWNQNPIFTGLSATLTSPYSGAYNDEGDSWNYLTAESGWFAAPTPGGANLNLGECLVLGGFTADELSSADGVTLWRNVIDYVLGCGSSATEASTWGALRSIYR